MRQLLDLERLASRRPAAALAALAASLAAGAILVSNAAASDRVYWANLGGNVISYANQDGSGGGADLSSAGATINFPSGLTLDPAGGRFYWASSALGGGAQAISYANLDGSGGGSDLNTAGATLSTPVGLAVDPAAGRVYWANNGSGTPPFAISYANLDGSGGKDLNTGSATLDTPGGVVLDLAAGRIYWANGGASDSISYAALDGSGGADLSTAGATASGPDGVALDPATGRIYWANLADEISFAALDGSGGGADINTSGATTNFPIGVAIDPSAGRIYWANSNLGGGGPQAVSFAGLDNSGGGDLSTAGATLNAPTFPALLHSPTGTGSPQLSGGAGARARISCPQGSWASDRPESRLFRAPSSYSYSWSRYGKKIHGASASTYRPHAVGNYRCTVTGKNPAGQSTQTSSTHAAFAFGQLVRNKRRGRAKLIVKVPSRGRLILRGKKVKRQGRRTHLASRSKHLHKAALLIRAKGSAKRKLKRTGGATLKLAVKFKPKGGKAGTLTRTVTLRFRRPPPSRVLAAEAFPLGLGKAR